MRYLTTGTNHNTSAKTRRGHGSQGASFAARKSAGGWLVPGDVLMCSCCRGDLIEWDTVQQATRRLPRLPFWRPDTRRIIVRCNSCKHFHEVFAYRVFNWIPPQRLTTEMALLNVLIGLLVVCSTLPHHSMATLMPL